MQIKLLFLRKGKGYYALKNSVCCVSTCDPVKPLVFLLFCHPRHTGSDTLKGVKGLTANTTLIAADMYNKQIKAPSLLPVERKETEA